jgi:hypothetical protein
MASAGLEITYERNNLPLPGIELEPSNPSLYRQSYRSFCLSQHKIYTHVHVICGLKIYLPKYVSHYLKKH